MSTPAEQAALGFFSAWLQSKAPHGTVQYFGHILSEDGGIKYVRVKVNDVILTVSPWADHLGPPEIVEREREQDEAHAQASDIRPIPTDARGQFITSPTTVGASGAEVIMVMPHRPSYDEVQRANHEAAEMIRQGEIDSGKRCAKCGMLRPCYHYVACPSCGARRNEPCVVASGLTKGETITGKPHNGRKQAAQDARSG